jgi:DNA-binding NtrC family response regulator
MPDSPASSVPASTILVVDDDPVILRLVGSILSAAGYEVLAADGGWSAVHAFEESTSPIHLLLTDVVMPDLTGPVLALRLRAQQPDLRVLFISGFHDGTMVQQFASLKGFPMVPKPFTPEGLLRAVAGALS